MAKYFTLEKYLQRYYCSLVNKRAIEQTEFCA